MPTEPFEWSEFEVPSLAGAVTVSLPDLTPWPTPIAKAQVLLESAAEVEHALMVQYLYAAFSLKTSKEVTDPAQKAVLSESSPRAWPASLLSIAREEMGHLMTVQNLLLLLGLAPNFEREDFPPRKDLYPFALHLEPLTQRSLAKYVVAEAPSDAEGIDDVLALATESAGATINHVGVLYGLLGLVFSTEDQVKTGASGDAEWDGIVRQLSAAAYQQAPASSWHLADADFHSDSVAQQADPDDWQVSHLRVHRTADRAQAVQALRDIGEQGEGPTGSDEPSHFARFLGMFRGQGTMAAFPAAGEWVPTRAAPSDPKVQDFTEPRTRRWAELADIRYALLLGFIEHYLLAPAARSVLTGWIFAEMRSRIGFMGRELTGMPRGGGADAGVAAIAFTLPADLHLPGDEPARWLVHRGRTEAAIAKIEEMRAGDAGDGQSAYLAELLESDNARLALMSAPDGPVTTSFARDIRPLFRVKDVQHMSFNGVDLDTYDGARGDAAKIVDKVRAGLMPPRPDQPWTKPQVDLVDRWIKEGFPK
jgi:hypothetical protein